MNIMKHNYLQSGQGDVVGEEVRRNICDPVGGQAPARKKVQMRWKLKQTKEIQSLTKSTRRCCWRGSRLEYL